MKRRDFCVTAGVATLASLTSFPRSRLATADIADAATEGSERALTGPLASKRMQFFDLWKLDAGDNCQLTLGCPDFV